MPWFLSSICTSPFVYTSKHKLGYAQLHPQMLAWLVTRHCAELNIFVNYFTRISKFSFWYLLSSCWLIYDPDTGQGTLWAFLGPVIAIVLVRITVWKKFEELYTKTSTCTSAIGGRSPIFGAFPYHFNQHSALLEFSEPGKERMVGWAHSSGAWVRRKWSEFEKGVNLH